MKKKFRFKTLLASLLVTASLVVPSVVLSVTENNVEAELIFQGAELRYCDDGSVQAIFNVAVDGAVNISGTAFNLTYNPEYLTPSYIADTTDSRGKLHKANEIVATGGGSRATDVFFGENFDLYGKTDTNNKPISIFAKKYNMIYDYSYLDPNKNTIGMFLWVDQDTLKLHGAGGELDELKDIGQDESETVFLLNPRNTGETAKAKKLMLGQLSFRVNKEHLAEMVDLFNGLDKLRKRQEDNPSVPHNNVNAPYVSMKSLTDPKPDTFLLNVETNILENVTGGMGASDIWNIACYYGDEGDRTEHYYGPSRTDDGAMPDGDNVGDHYIFNFDKRLIIDVEATNPEITINAYQNFTTGKETDLPLSLGRYCPTVTVTYADGSKENVPFPWGGRAGAPDNDEYTVTSGLADPYDPTHGDYTFSQLYKYQVPVLNSDNTQATDPGTGEPLFKTAVFPKPVTATLHVTPITVIDVTANDLERTYDLNDVTERVRNVGDLALPEQAQIITDIVPAGVSLVTPIKGWKPVQPDSWTTGDPYSTWPTTSMNSLKAKTYDDTTKVPYWPDRAVDGTSLTPANHVGTYVFETSQADHATAEGILSADIRTAFPWLTVPDQSAKPENNGVDQWNLTNAKRHIVPHDKYPDVNNYVVTYFSTVTQTNSADGNGDGQPTLTLSVERKDGASMDANAIFRTWLPNGMEIITGEIGGGISVDPKDYWFGGAAYSDHKYGHYHTDGTISNATNNTHFHLITNPGDPTAPTTKGEERETLRRYINLGGWYKVAICETPNPTDPSASLWTDPIPVYVPPRPNEYQESKIYNFIAENASLANWPGGVGDTLYLPRGMYTPVGPTGTANTSGVGLPLYWNNNAVTDGKNDLPSILINGNIHRPVDGIQRYEESYGVKTTYDGQTGAQPGEIYNVRVDQADKTHTDEWKPRADGKLDALLDSADIYKYGPTPLYHGHRVPAYGEILNVETVAGNRDYTTHKATLRTEKDNPAPDPSLREEIRLVSYSPTGITRVVQNDYESNVTLVTYDTQMEGYTVRQDYVLTIKNVGDVDIYGLDIDGLTDGYPADKPGGRFEMLQPPASFLPAGSSTTFTLTYVYNLKNNEAEDTPLKYRDTLYITSTSHPTPGKYKDDGSGNNVEDKTVGDYLLDFDAEFTVSRSALHKVTVIYKPENGKMGDAGLIVGEQGTPGNETMNTTVTTRTYPQGDKVYVEVRPEDEYEVKSIIMTDSAGNIITDNKGQPIELYPGPATVEDGKLVYDFEMPNQDVTVIVNFYEPILSKLRLSDLIDFSAPPGPNGVSDSDLVHAGYDPRQDSTDPDTRAKAYTPNDPGHIYSLWQKSFDGTAAKGDVGTPGYKAPTGDYEDAANWSAGHGNADENFYLMTEGTAIPRADGGNQYNSSKSHYLVVIDAEDDFSQIKATLRNVQFHEDYQGVTQKTDPNKPGYDPNNSYPNGYNEDIKPTVNMTVFYENQVLDNWSNTNPPLAVYDNGHGYGPYDTADTDITNNPRNQRPQGDTAKKTMHVSDEFASPDYGKSAYVHITVTLGTESRHYYVEIHRKAKAPEVVLHYGNSPYGMIMNDPKFIVAGDPDQTKAAQKAAKEAFDKANFTFRGAAPNNLPTAVADHGMDAVTYWREAWVRNQGLFEPESFTAINDFLDPNDQWPDVYSNARNLDLNDDAFFAVLGQNLREPGVVSAKDSSGREVPLYKISARMVGEKAGEGITLLDTTQTKQVDRFSGTDTVFIDLGIAGRTLTYKTTTAALDAPDAQLGVKNWPVETTETTTAGTTTKTYEAVTDLRPGQYFIEYSFIDFDGDSTLSVTRPLVILREVGDVNVDGGRDSGSHTPGTDEYAIEDRVTNDPLGYEAGQWSAANGETVYPHANIFKFRVCDVNNDRNINNIDANQVAENVKKGGGWLKFYDSEHYGLTAPEVTAPPAPTTP